MIHSVLPHSTNLHIHQLNTYPPPDPAHPIACTTDNIKTNLLVLVGIAYALHRDKASPKQHTIVQCVEHIGAPYSCVATFRSEEMAVQPVFSPVFWHTIWFVFSFVAQCCRYLTASFIARCTQAILDYISISTSADTVARHRRLSRLPAPSQ